MGKMERVLTDEERAAIEAYSGPVKRVPRGASSMPVPKWDEAEGRLRYEEPLRKRRQNVPAHMLRFYRAQDERRHQVRDWVALGIIQAEIARRMGVTEKTIAKDIAALRAEGRLA